MRNNEERLGTPIPQIDTTAETANSDKTFNFVVPTEFVDLPSKGRFYPADHPWHNKDSIEIKFMTAREEDILTSKSLLKKGIAIDRFIQSVLVEPVSVDSILVGDKNAIVVAARISGYGAEYNTTVSCPLCGEKSHYTFDLNTSKVDFALEQKYLDSGHFIIHLPKINADIECRLLTGADEKRLVQQVELRKKANLPESVSSDQFRLFIEAVNGSKDQKHINSLVDVLPASDARFLRSEYVKYMPNIDLTQKFVCSHCESEADIEVPLTADFFWPK